MMAVQLSRPPAPSKGQEKYQQEGEQAPRGELLGQTKECRQLPAVGPRNTMDGTQLKSVSRVAGNDLPLLLLSSRSKHSLWPFLSDCKGVNTVGKDEARMAFASHDRKPEVVG